MASFYDPLPSNDGERGTNTNNLTDMMELCLPDGFMSHDISFISISIKVYSDTRKSMRWYAQTEIA
jgi:hypothetical protein